MTQADETTVVDSGCQKKKKMNLSTPAESVFHFQNFHDFRNTDDFPLCHFQSTQKRVIAHQMRKKKKVLLTQKQSIAEPVHGTPPVFSP